ncbi:MAG TPA: hypothetical protein DCF33_22095 [Saprospirales bacterium]|nr:hypothetical protein [Saprospirales bacterium]
MKQQFFFSTILLTFTLFLFNCTQPTPPAAVPDLKQEESAILKAIENESRTFYKKDHDAWSSHYIHSPKVHWVCVETDVTLRADGWEDLSKFVTDWMKENPEPMDYDQANFQDSNVQVTISGDLAFVSMKSSNKQPDGSMRQLIGSRTMLRENGSWKILSMTSYPSDMPEGSTANVYVHKNAK